MIEPGTPEFGELFGDGGFVRAWRLAVDGNGLKIARSGCPVRPNHASVHQNLYLHPISASSETFYQVENVRKLIICVLLAKRGTMEDASSSQITACHSRRLHLGPVIRLIPFHVSMHSTSGDCIHSAYYNLVSSVSTFRLLFMGKTFSRARFVAAHLRT